jgi:hypothetical protein
MTDWISGCRAEATLSNGAGSDCWWKYLGEDPRLSTCANDANWECPTTGKCPQQGIYSSVCCRCEVTLRENERLPNCPNCSIAEWFLVARLLMRLVYHPLLGRVAERDRRYRLVGSDSNWWERRSSQTTNISVGLKCLDPDSGR